MEVNFTSIWQNLSPSELLTSASTHWGGTSTTVEPVSSLLASASTSLPLDSARWQSTSTSTYVYSTTSAQTQATNEYTSETLTSSPSYDENNFYSSSRPQSTYDYSNSNILRSTLTSAPSSTTAYETMSYSSAGSQADFYSDHSDLSIVTTSTLSYPTSSSSLIPSDYYESATTSTSNAKAIFYSSSNSPSWTETTDFEISETSSWWSYTSSPTWDDSYSPSSSNTGSASATRTTVSDTFGIQTGAYITDDSESSTSSGDIWASSGETLVPSYTSPSASPVPSTTTIEYSSSSYTSPGESSVSTLSESLIPSPTSSSTSSVLIATPGEPSIPSSSMLIATSNEPLIPSVSTPSMSPILATTSSESLIPSVAPYSTSLVYGTPPEFSSSSAIFPEASIISTETSSWDSMAAPSYYSSEYSSSVSTPLVSSISETAELSTTSSTVEWYSSGFPTSLYAMTPSISVSVDSLTLPTPLSAYYTTTEQTSQIWTSSDTFPLEATTSFAAESTGFPSLYNSATHTTPISTWEPISSTWGPSTTESFEVSNSNFYYSSIIPTDITSTVESSVNSVTNPVYWLDFTSSTTTTSIGEPTSSDYTLTTSSYIPFTTTEWSDATPTTASSVVEAALTTASIWSGSTPLDLLPSSSFTSSSSGFFTSSTESAVPSPSIRLNYTSSLASSTGSATKSKNSTRPTSTANSTTLATSSKLSSSRLSSSHSSSVTSANTGYSVSYDTKYAYYIYTQTYIITDATTTFGTGIPTTVEEPRSVSTTFSAPQTIVTQDMQFYNNWLNSGVGHTNAQHSSGSGKSDTGKIVGGVVGGVCGFLACCLVTWIFFRRRRNGHKGILKSAQGFSSEIGSRMDDSSSQEPQVPAFGEKPQASSDNNNNGTPLFSIFRTQKIPETENGEANLDLFLNPNQQRESKASENPFRDEFNFRRRPAIPPPVPPPRKMHSNTQYPATSRSSNTPRDNRSSYVSSLGDSSFVSSLQGDYSTLSSGPIRLDPGNYNAGNPEGPHGGFFREVV
ncbi:ZYBA0S04-01926g1_1 [Zygosaccharomyces bailii CLIB 213]|uniref:ZYBA0S04-01926g1_1 n=1 Tax=Zygosaccharomyces bailii (strain CLIB 213 / ATCC 58445 / CBS 680 / BCRC 21525 / NBRC 1098 / NCYC 1416 / NRRL Y-2227) TaxID=1333698 RepID=A0A8J2WZB8_ZYGB2|nr:ZYBA0S04-01926g1_1 [Zygosaccharomyces bailii CLIB 213]